MNITHLVNILQVSTIPIIIQPVPHDKIIGNF